MPTPAEAGKEGDAKAQPEQDVRLVDIKPRDWRPVWIRSQWRPVDEPWIVFRHIDEVGICRLNDDRLSLGGHGLLGCALQVARALCALPHGLNRSEYTLLIVHKGVAECRGPREVLAHVLENRGELRERLYTRIPARLADGST